MLSLGAAPRNCDAERYQDGINYRGNKVHRRLDGTMMVAQRDAESSARFLGRAASGPTKRGFRVEVRDHKALAEQVFLVLERFV